MLWSYTVAAMSDTTLVTMSSIPPRVTAQWLRPFVHSPTQSLVILTLMKWKPKGSEALTSSWWEYWGLCLLTPGAAITSEELVSSCEKTGTNGDLPSTWLHFRPACLKYLHQWNHPSNKYKKYTQWIYNMRVSSARVGLRSGMERIFLTAGHDHAPVMLTLLQADYSTNIMACTGYWWSKIMP